ncbi:Adenine DNA glycosylase [Flavobacterium longum]|uniref:A/G-specific adenine glycosylase n=1 Tax=Flavobacterium longum TaxID=1299340 RepID=UPI0039EB83A6
MPFAKLLITWYLNNKRDLPWRDTTDPYLIWLSEIMLQQTRVAQGLPYFLTFSEHFPTVSDLARADEQQVLRLWQGLGYYSRARNLHQTAKYIAFELAGKFPENYHDLLKLKGVGDYTAAAIASFAYGEAVPVVDGNVFRVLSRYFGIESDIAQQATKKEFTALAAELMPPDSAALFNQAIMEFGALQCTPKNPDCDTCPLNDGCLAVKYNKVSQLPVKSKKSQSKSRYFSYLVYEDESGHTMIQKRTAKDIWHNLYEFPLVESVSAQADLSKVIESAMEKQDIISVKTLDSKATTHKLTHQSLHIRFVSVKVRGRLADGVAVADLEAYPFPIVLANFIKNHWK